MSASPTIVPPLPISPPQRLQLAFSHEPHPYPQPSFTTPVINPASTAQKAREEAQREAVLTAAREAQNRGAGFSPAVSSRALRRRTLFPSEEVMSVTDNGRTTSPELKPTVSPAVAASVARRSSLGQLSTPLGLNLQAATAAAAAAATTPTAAAAAAVSPRPPALMRTQSLVVGTQSPAHASSAAAAAVAATSIAATPSPARPSTRGGSSRAARATLTSPTAISTALKAATTAAAPAPAAPAVPLSAPLDILTSLAKAGSDRTDAEVRSLESWLRSFEIPFFAEVDQATLRLLCQRLRYERVPKDRVVMREGTQADALFVLLAGSVSVWNESFRDFEKIDAMLDQTHAAAAAAAPTDADTATRPSSEARTLAELTVALGRKPKFITSITATPSKHPLFGELGLMSDQLRTATVIAEGGGGAAPPISPDAVDGATAAAVAPLPSLPRSASVAPTAAAPFMPTEFLVVDKIDFDSVLRRVQSERFAEKISALRSLRVFQGVSERQLVKISIYFTSSTLPAHSVVIKKGQVADRVIFLAEGEVEVCEMLPAPGHGVGVGDADSSPITLIHLGLLGPGELISDAAVFDSLLLHPWDIRVRSPTAKFLSIEREEFIRRIRSDILTKVRAVTFAKKDLRDRLRAKAVKQMKAAEEMQSPRIKQAQKLLAQVSMEKKVVDSGGKLAATSPMGMQPKHFKLSHPSPRQQQQQRHVLPRKIRETLVKNVVQASASAFASLDAVVAKARQVLVVGESPAEDAAEASAVQPTRPKTSQEHSRPAGRALNPRIASAARQAPSAALLRPSTSPASSTAPLESSSEEDHSPARVRFAATADLSLPLVSDEHESNAAKSADDTVSTEKGDLLVQKNPFAYDAASGLSSHVVAAAHALQTHRDRSLSPTRRRLAPGSLLPVASADAPRQQYPFGHIHASINVEGAGDANHENENHSAAAHGLTTTPPHIDSAHVRHGSTASSSSGPLSLISVDEATEGTPSEYDVVPFSVSSLMSPQQPVSARERRDSEQRASIVQSQIRGHRRNVSSHRGSVTQASPLPFAMGSTLKPPPSPSVHVSDSASQIAAPVIILPSPSSVGAAFSSPSVGLLSTAPLQLGTELIAPVPSFSHISPNCYRDQVPVKQFYGKMHFRRPSAALNTPARGGAAAGTENDTSPRPQAATVASFQQASAAHANLSPVKVAVSPSSQPSPADSRSVTPPLPSSSAPVSAAKTIPSLQLQMVQSDALHSSAAAPGADTGSLSERSSAVSLQLSSEPRAMTARPLTGSRAAVGSAAAARASHSARSSRYPVIPSVPSQPVDENSDSDEELSVFQPASRKRGGSSQKRVRALHAATKAALASDPLLLMKEDVKWSRQIDAWHRTLVVPPSSFLEDVVGEAAVAPTTVHRASGAAGQALQLTPPNVEVFTTRSELSAAQIASPLLLVPRASPLHALQKAAIPYLYPTTRETGSITQTRELTSALDNLQDAIATDFANPALTHGQRAAQDLAARIETKRQLEEDIALKRLAHRMKPEEELMVRLTYTPRTGHMVSTTQAQRRHMLLTESGALGSGIISAGPTASKDMAWARERAQKRKELLRGRGDGMTPRQRRAKQQEEMEKKRVEDEAAKATADADAKAAEARAEEEKFSADGAPPAIIEFASPSVFPVSDHGVDLASDGSPGSARRSLAKGPHLSGEQRVLHSGKLELSRDVELEYGVQWHYFEDRAPSKRSETFERFVQQHQDAPNQAQAIQQSMQLSRSRESTPYTGALGHIRTATQVIDGEQMQRAVASAEAEEAQRQLVQRVHVQQVQRREYELKHQARQEEFAQQKRTLVALTPHDQGPAAVLGASAPRLYHWAAMLHAPESNAPAAASRPATATPLLSVDALTQSLREAIPVPPLSTAPPAKEPTLTQLTHEIALYRRDLRVLRRDMHAASSGGSGAVARPFTPATSLIDATSREEGLRARAARDAILAKRLARDMFGSPASADVKIMRLRRDREGPLVEFEGSEVAAATAEDEKLLTARRFWRHSSQLRTWRRPGSEQHAGVERMQAKSVTAPLAFIADGSKASGAADAAEEKSAPAASPLPTSAAASIHADFAALPTVDPASSLPPRPTSSGMVTPRLSDVLARVGAPASVPLLIQARPLAKVDGVQPAQPLLLTKRPASPKLSSIALMTLRAQQAATGTRRPAT